MNLVIDDAEEIFVGKVPKPRRAIGKCRTPQVLNYLAFAQVMDTPN